MKKMMNPELEVVRFGAEDVIATSGGDSKYNISAGNYSIYVSPFESVPHPEVTYQAHACDNEALHFHVLSQNTTSMMPDSYWGMAFDPAGGCMNPESYPADEFANGVEDGFYFSKDNKWVFCPDSGK